MSVNKVIILGNVTAQPEIRNTNDGREIVNFSIATNEKWKSKDGTKNEKVEYHRIVVFSQGLVNVIKNYVKKGSKLYIEGQLQTRKYTDSNGVDKYITEIVLQNYNSNLIMLNSKNDGEVVYKSTLTQKESEEKEQTFDDKIPF